MRIVFIRPPRYFWPFNSESSSFWQPLGFISMASVVRENGFECEIIDCLAFKMGWKSLKKRLKNLKADIVCVGDDSASADEGIKVIKFIKSINKNVVCVGGGYHYPYLPKESFDDYGFDYLIKGEGEQTILELISFLSKKKLKKIYSKDGKKKINSLKEIKGLIFRSKDNSNNNKNKIVFGEERAPIDLNKLPLPAYDLLPMHLYGNESRNHKNFSAIEHGRGCSGGCSFCSISNLYSFKGNPNYRTKSAKKCFEETKSLVEKYDRKILNWVDGTFNLDLKWSEEYFSLLEKNRIKVKHTAWMRADCIVRDEKKGILKKMVKNGLVQVVIGAERFEDNPFSMKNKDYEISKKAFLILNKYPSVYVIASWIYGLPKDNIKTLFRLSKKIAVSKTDFNFLLPFTPYPASKEWIHFKNKIPKPDFKRWNLHLPVIRTSFFSFFIIYLWFFLNGVFLLPLTIKEILTTDKRKRAVNISLFKKTISLFFFSKYGKKPKWYDS